MESDKKGIPEFWRIFFCCRCGYIMHVSVYENCRIQSTSIWYKNHQDILNITKVMTGYIQEPRPKILVKFQSGHKGFLGSPPHPGCIMIYSYHQMCLALNSKLYWSNEQVVPLLGCCSDAPGSPGNRLVICGDRTFFQLNFLGQSMPEIYLEKIAALLHTSWPKIRPIDASFLSSLSMYSTRLPCNSKSANLFFSKITKFYRNWSFSAIPGPIFCSQHIYWSHTSGQLAASFWNQNAQSDDAKPGLSQATC